MTKENEKKLLRAIAENHIGDEIFCKKYGISFYHSQALLECARENKEPSKELLDKENEIFIKIFSESLEVILNSAEENETFFNELLKNF